MDMHIVHDYSHLLTLAIMVVLHGIDTRKHCNNEVIELFLGTVMRSYTICDCKTFGFAL